MDFDYGIIGGGPAGYTVAMKLAKQGAKVILFEKEFLGGTCLNRGCIPTKSMLHSSEIYKLAIKAQEFGIEVNSKSFDFSKVIEKREKTIEKIRKSLELAVKNSGVQVVYAEATVKNKNTIVADKEYLVNQIILSTGSKPREIKGLEFDGKFVLSSNDLLKINKLPKNVLIVGSGAIGIEWARIFSNFGVNVTIVEKAEHLLPIADLEVSKRIERIFKQQGIKYHTNTAVSNTKENIVTLDNGMQIETDFVLSAVGRESVCPKNIDAQIIGDACGEVLLAHYAIYQGMNYSEEAIFSPNKNLVPSVVYGEPEIAWIGVREQDCGEDCTKITLPITALGKSWCDDSTDGFIKIIVKNDYIVGAHIVSKEASALIHQLLIAMQNYISVSELKKTCFAHPTYSEGVLEAICRL